MKQFDDIFKERLDGYEMKLPTMDQQSFWSTKAVRERAAKRRRSILAIAVGLPAVAAVLMAVIMTMNLLTQKDSSPNTDTVTTTEQSDTLTKQILVSPE
ncbi:MAG: hypothetical protein J6W42_00530 [Bacteroidaceae bacterium]|nr:hypothetical protein [Bacteroidaceae bacterium]